MSNLFFFKQKAAYEMRISDWSSDVCSSDLDPQLPFRLAAWDIELKFRPLDFIQVNAGLNEKMIARTLELLDVQPGERVLDLFCGLGNFTLPLARVADARLEGSRVGKDCVSTL